MWLITKGRSSKQKPRLCAFFPLRCSPSSCFLNSLIDTINLASPSKCPKQLAVPAAQAPLLQTEKNPTPSLLQARKTLQTKRTSTRTSPPPPETITATGATSLWTRTKAKSLATTTQPPCVASSKSFSLIKVLSPAPPRNGHKHP